MTCCARAQTERSGTPAGDLQPHRLMARGPLDARTSASLDTGLQARKAARVRTGVRLRLQLCARTDAPGRWQVAQSVSLFAESQGRPHRLAALGRRAAAPGG